MDDPLAIYIHNHLAACASAVHLLDAICKKHVGDSLGEFATALQNEIAEDRLVLQNLADRMGSETIALRGLSGWLNERVNRFKLHHGADGLGTLEVLEFLAMEVIGKMSLWRALGAVASIEPRLQGIDFDHLASRANTQYAWIEDRRIEVAKLALSYRRAA